jgi:hypothetical protein
VAELVQGTAALLELAGTALALHLLRVPLDYLIAYRRIEQGC